MKSQICLVGFLICFCFSSATSARDVGVALRVSTLGGVIETATPIGEKLNARLGINGASLSYSGTESGNEYDFDFTLFKIAVLVDWHALDGSFRLCSGVLLNNSGLDAKAKAGIFGSEYDIGGTRYTPAEVGTFEGEIDFNILAPYVGIGWGNMAGKDKRLGLLLDVGIMVQGSPTVSLSTEKKLPDAAAQAELEADLRRERNDMEEAVESFSTYPVVSLGVSYML